MKLENLHPAILSLIRITIGVLCGGAILYIFLASLLYFNQQKYVYFPEKNIQFTPKDNKLDYEDAYFTTEDGVKLNGWYIPAKNEKGVILFCHGNGGNIEDFDTIEIFNKLGLTTFIFDYRGYGKSEGEPWEEGTYKDAEAAWKWLTKEKGISPDRIIIAGRSLGGAIASYLAQKENPCGLIVESSFTSLPDIAAEVYPYFPVRLLARMKYPTIEYIQKIKCPILIIHSPQDELVPYKHGQKLFESAKEPKHFLEIVGMHNDGFTYAGKKYTDAISKFADECVKK